MYGISEYSVIFSVYLNILLYARYFQAVSKLILIFGSEFRELFLLSVQLVQHVATPIVINFTFVGGCLWVCVRGCVCVIVLFN